MIGIGEGCNDVFGLFIGGNENTHKYELCVKMEMQLDLIFVSTYVDASSLKLSRKHLNDLNSRREIGVKQIVQSETRRDHACPVGILTSIDPR
jgi:hypothetical protein